MNPQEDQALVPAKQDTEARAVTKFTAEHGREVGLPSPEAVNYMMSVAKLMLDSSLITGDMGNTPEKIRSNALAKMLIGHELSMKPMEALQSIDIVKGKIFVRYPQLINQLLLRGFNLKWVERSNERAALRLTHKNPEIEPEDFEFTIEDAKRAGLVYADSQYIKRPRVMLTARVVSEAYRSTGGQSNVYTPEERHEIVGNGNEPERALLAAPEHDPYEVKIPDAAPAATPAPEPKVELHTKAYPCGASVNGPTPLPEACPVHGEVCTTLENAPEPPLLKQAPMHPSSAPEPSQVAEMPKKPNPVIGPLMAEIEKLLPAKTRKKIVEEFLRGYFNVGDIKSVLGNPAMVPALEILRALALGERWKTNLAVDPHRFGVDTAAGFDRLWQYVADWPDVLQVQAGKIALRLYPDSGGGELRDYLEDPIQAHSLPFPELAAFLWVLERVPPKDATIFRECAIEMAATAAPWGDLTAEELVAAIAALEVGPHTNPDDESGEPGQQSLLEMIRGGEAK